MAYLVRLWQVNSEGQPAWHASLEDPHTGERRGFADLPSLFAFLEKQVRVASEPAWRVSDSTRVRTGDARAVGGCTRVESESVKEVDDGRN
jgi:hypothetical protein